MELALKMIDALRPFVVEGKGEASWQPVPGVHDAKAMDNILDCLLALCPITQTVELHGNTVVGIRLGSTSATVKISWEDPA